jgi:hypothetical protein
MFAISFRQADGSTDTCLPSTTRSSTQTLLVIVTLHLIAMPGSTYGRPWVVCCSGIQFSSSPMCRDKPLRDTLSISDIPGAVPRPKTPAARAAAARAAAAQATACTSSSSSPGCADGINHCSRAGVLEVGDIDGAYAAWRPTNRSVLLRGSVALAGCVCMSAISVAAKLL